METPIYDFVKEYIKSGVSRLHMPGHKGKNNLGCEAFDITEFDGADSLYEADGIIAQSEKNASMLFGTRSTFYSAEGSSLCIRAMLYLAMLNSKEEKKVILAGRNAHKVFMYSSALLDFEVRWMYGKGENLISCEITPTELENAFSDCNTSPFAVYITSPDYLGNIADIKGLSEVCHRHGVPLLVDNAHGAYTKFLPTSLHPIDLGADMCCDSAHKTLPALTGAAYLHVSSSAPRSFSEYGKGAMALFGSTSPSYLILQSLDLVNRALSEEFPKALLQCVKRVTELKKCLEKAGFEFIGSEPTKLTILAKKYGYTGFELAGVLKENKVMCEFCDNDFTCLMFSVQNDKRDFDRIKKALISLCRKPEIISSMPSLGKPKFAMSARLAMMKEREALDIKQCKGRILASSNVACPPAIPIVVCGEVIDENAIKCFEYYGIKKAEVVKS